MSKEDILNRLLKSYNRCKEHEKTNEPHKMAFCYGMLYEAVNYILKEEKVIKASS